MIGDILKAEHIYFIIWRLRYFYNVKVVINYYLNEDKEKI